MTGRRRDCVCFYFQKSLPKLRAYTRKWAERGKVYGENGKGRKKLWDTGKKKWGRTHQRRRWRSFSAKQMMGGDPHFFCRRWDPQFVSSLSIGIEVYPRSASFLVIWAGKLWESGIKKSYKKYKKKWKKHKKNGMSYWQFSWKDIYSFSPSQHWVATQNKQKVLWQIREGNNWLNNFFYVFYINEQKHTREF